MQEKSELNSANGMINVTYEALEGMVEDVVVQELEKMQTNNIGLTLTMSQLKTFIRQELQSMRKAKKSGMSAEELLHLQNLSAKASEADLYKPNKG